MQPALTAFARRTLVVLALAVALLLAWRIADILLLVAGAIVLAVVLRGGGRVLARVVPVPVRWAVLLAVLLMLAGLVVLGVVLGDQVAGEVTALRERLPQALAQGRAWLEGSGIGRGVLGLLEELPRDGVSAGTAMSTASGTLDALARIALVALLTLYLAFDPDTYMRGLLRLLPAGRRDGTRDALHAAGAALRGWLLGQGVSMLAVGVLIGAGLWLLGIPMALTLALLAALLEFVPVLGPLVAAIPAILIAFAQSPVDALWVAALFFVVQQLEGYVIFPLAQRWAVRLPPALGLVAIVVFGTLFGLPGLLFATPLTVVLIALVRRHRPDGEPVTAGRPGAAAADSPSGQPPHGAEAAGAIGTRAAP